MTTFYSILADLVLLVHFSYVAFVVLGLALVWVGFFLRWSWVKNVWFRGAHLLAMAAVVLESLFGVTCPLTTWENHLRLLAGGGERYEKSFVAHWIHKVMFFDLEPRTFTVIYIVFFGALVLSFLLVPPRSKRSRGGP